MLDEISYPRLTIWECYNPMDDIELFGKLLCIICFQNLRENSS